MKVTDQVGAIVGDAIKALGFELDEVEFVKEHGAWVLTLYIDAPTGVTIDDCERVSRAVEPLVDAADPIEQAYYLSVSSIGIDRPLKKDKDFERNMAKRVTVKLYAPIEKKKEFMGTLVAFDDASFTIGLEGGSTMAFLKKDVALIRPYIDFSERPDNKREE